MSKLYRNVKHVSFALLLAAGTSGLALAQTNAGQNQPPKSQAQEEMHEKTSSWQNQDKSNNAQVRDAQEQLKQKGFYKGEVDGINGPKTKSAIREYQRSENLKTSGRLDQATLSSLGVEGAGQQNRGEAARSAEPAQENGNTAKTGNKGERYSQDTVKSVQQKLADDGLYKGEVNGKMDAATEDALRQYQKKHNLTANGRLTPETAKSMGISIQNQMNHNDQMNPNENGEMEHGRPPMQQPQSNTGGTPHQQKPQK